ncbi:N-acetylmuramoyl-L-alanine amidase family protein [Paenibacillus borealis]|uniref:N-acetylmuramoyl-L-alanine amidase family protein n=1 Tax=Paenibacillus borealis TaxID=160799 RepID=UPI001FE112BE|nr:N-acetylmuramoyl-L-alanine amidase [Paenibacillus borealis]
MERLLLQEPAFHIVMTRRDDTYHANSRRADMANELQADAFVSIHANSVKDKPNVREPKRIITAKTVKLWPM